MIDYGSTDKDFDQTGFNENTNVIFSLSETIYACQINEQANRNHILHACSYQKKNSNRGTK